MHSLCRNEISRGASRSIAGTLCNENRMKRPTSILLLTYSHRSLDLCLPYLFDDSRYIVRANGYESFEVKCLIDSHFIDDCPIPLDLAVLSGHDGTSLSWTKLKNSYRVASQIHLAIPPNHQR